MSGIFDQIINYSPPLIVSGTVNYKGTWNASTNNPTLNSSPAASTKGDYYVVSTAGTQFGITFAIGDWIISNGTAWEKVDLTDAVSSVFGRTGAVVGVSTDYSAVGLTNTAIGASNPSTGAFTSLSSSSTTTLNGTTIPTSSTLLVSGGALGTPSSGTLSSCTGLPISTGVSGLGTGIATALAVNTGSAGAPVLFNGALGTPTSGTVTNLTGTASININGTVGATTPSTGDFTTVTATGTISTSGGSLETSRTGAVDAFVRISADAGRSKNLSLNTSGARRWTVSSNSTAESGANAGSDFVLTAYSDADASLGSALTITRSNRSAVFAGGINSTAIGATTASTGAFTTGNFSSTLFAGGVTTLRGANVPIANNSGFLIVGSSDTAAADLGGSLGFTANTTSLSNYPMGNISARLVATGAGAYASYMAFATTDGSGSVAERMRLTSTGLAVTGTSTSSGSMRITTNNVYYRGTTSGNAEQILIGIGSDDNTAIVSKSGNTIKMDAGGTTRGTFSSTGLTLPSLGTGLVYSNAGLLTSTNPSDARLKTDITNLSYGLSSILALRPVSYKWLSDTVNQGTQYGFIAQEVQTVMPELVKEFETTEDGKTVTRLGLEKEGIYAALVKAVQELNGLNTNLVAQVEILSQRLASLETK